MIDADGEDTPIELHRSVPPLDLVPFVVASYTPNNPCTPRPPSTLPEPGKIHAHVTMGKRSGSGRIGIVYEVDPVASAVMPGHLPPLVLKIGRSNRRAEISYEAWFYDELECLQGVVLPRSYGWFEAELSKGHTLGAWPLRIS